MGRGLDVNVYLNSFCLFYRPAKRDFKKTKKQMKMSGTTGDSILETLRADLALSLIPSSLFFLRLTPFRIPVRIDF